VTVRLEELLAAADPKGDVSFSEHYAARERLGLLAPDAVRLLIDMGKALTEIGASGVSFNDPRIEWVEAQVDRDTLLAIPALLARLDRLGTPAQPTRPEPPPIRVDPKKRWT